MLLSAPPLLKRWTPLVVRLPAVRARSPAEIRAPPVVIVRPLPMTAALVTLRPVPAAVKKASAFKVLLPAKVWAAVLTRPALLPSATARFKVEPVIVAPLAVGLPTAPTLLTPVPPVEVATQAVPFHIKAAEVLAAMLKPYIVKLALPLKELT